VAAEAELRATSKRPTSTVEMGEAVLLVEDNAEVRTVAARRLRNLGYAVIEAGDAAQAIEVLKSGRAIDLVFSDVVMPGGMSGFELAQWIRASTPAIPILLTSGFAEDVARAGEAASSDLEILRKPYSGTELARAVRRAIDGA
jgi:CheY-like chemotaxis protein